MSIKNISINEMKRVHAFNIEGMIQAIEDGHRATGLVITHPDKYESRYDFIKELDGYYHLIDEMTFYWLHRELVRLHKCNQIFCFSESKEVPILYFDEINSLLIT